MENIGILSVLLVLAVFDIRESRIPNVWLLSLFSIIAISKVVVLADGWQIITDLSSGLLFFSLALILHLINAMAPGDVKLLGVYGFLIGWDNALTAGYFLGIAMVLIGGLYLIHAHAREYHKSLLAEARDYFSATPVRPVSLYLFLTQYQGSVKRRTKQEQMADRMPFAPVVVIGYALYRYYGG